MGRPLVKTRKDKHDEWVNVSLREARIKKRYSGEEVANKAGINKVTFYAYEGFRNCPDVSVAKRIADVLDVDVNEIFPYGTHEVVSYVNRIRSGKNQSDFPKIKKTTDLVNYISCLEEIEYFEKYEKLPRLTCDGGFNQRENKEYVAKILGELNVRERGIIELKFGLADGMIYTNEEIGKIYEISHARVEQIYKKTLAKIRRQESLLERNVA
jgi:DNA-binding XRE family transcriptional regulator